MTWLILAVGYAMATSAHRIIAKPAAERLHPATIAWGAGLASLPIAFIIAVWGAHGTLWYEIAMLPLGFWCAILVQATLIWPLQYYCMYRTLQERALSWIFPMDGIVPVVSGVLAWIIWDERITPLGWLGVAVIVGGATVLNWQQPKIGSQIRRLSWELPVLQAICSACGSIIVKYTVSNCRFSTLVLVESVCGTAIQWLIATQFVKPGDTRKVWRNGWRLLSVGTLDTGDSALGIWALALGPIAQVTAVFRINLVFGFLLTQKQRSQQPLTPDQWKRRVRQTRASATIFIGVALISLSQFR